MTAEELNEKLFSSKIPGIKRHQNKDRRITLRTTPEVYEKVERLANMNGTTISEMTNQIVSNWLEEFIQLPFERARFFNTCAESFQECILNCENQLPSCYRQFTNGIKRYPDAGKLHREEIDAINNILIREVEEKNTKLERDG